MTTIQFLGAIAAVLLAATAPTITTVIFLGRRIDRLGERLCSRIDELGERLDERLESIETRFAEHA